MNEYQTALQKLLALPEDEFFSVLNGFWEKREKITCSMCGSSEFRASRGENQKDAFYGLVSSSWMGPLSFIWHVYLMVCQSCGHIHPMSYDPLVAWAKETGRG